MDIDAADQKRAKSKANGNGIFVESKISLLNCFDSLSGLAHVKMHKNSEIVKN